MTSVQFEQLRAALVANRQPVVRAERNAHPRGWNDALDFVERTIKDVLGEEREPEVPKQEALL